MYLVNNAREIAVATSWWTVTKLINHYNCTFIIFLQASCKHQLCVVMPQNYLAQEQYIYSNKKVVAK